MHAGVEVPTYAHDDYNTMLVTRPRDGVVLVTLNRESRMNAITFEMFDEMHTLCDRLQKDDQARCVIITGKGRGFCAGLDLDEAAVLPDMTSHEMMLGQQSWAGAFMKWHELPQPVIAAVNGAAAGGGLSLALCADMRIASPEARFNAAFVRIGLSAGDVGSSWSLPRVVGLGHAAEIMLTGRFVDAEEAEKIGLVNRVVPAEELLDAAFEVAAQIASNTPFGVTLTKRVLNANVDAGSLTQAVEVENRGQTLATRGADFARGAAGVPREARADVHRHAEPGSGHAHHRHRDAGHLGARDGGGRRRGGRRRARRGLGARALQPLGDHHGRGDGEPHVALPHRHRRSRTASGAARSRSRPRRATSTSSPDGRFVLGLGNGTRRMISDWHGLDPDAPAVRMEELGAAAAPAVAPARGADRPRGPLLPAALHAHRRRRAAAARAHPDLHRRRQPAHGRDGGPGRRRSARPHAVHAGLRRPTSCVPAIEKGAAQDRPRPARGRGRQLWSSPSVHEDAERARREVAAQIAFYSSAKTYAPLLESQRLRRRRRGDPGGLRRRRPGRRWSPPSRPRWSTRWRWPGRRSDVRAAATPLRRPARPRVLYAPSFRLSNERVTETALGLIAAAARPRPPRPDFTAASAAERPGGSGRSLADKPHGVDAKGPWAPAPISTRRSRA